MKQKIKFISLLVAINVTVVPYNGCAPVSFSTMADKANKFNNEPTLRRVDASFTVPPRKVDVLFVVDNSGSMAKEQANMGDSFPSFTDILNNYGNELDWQVGLITTDMSGAGELKDGNLIQLAGRPAGEYVLTKNTPDSNNVFKNTVKRPEKGSGDERGIYAAYRLLEKTGTASDRGLVRDEGQLGIVILSDENVRSTGGSNLEAKDKPETLISYFRDRWPSKRLSSHAVIIKPGDTTCLAKQRDANQLGVDGSYGTFYKDLVDLSNLTFMTGGILGDICDSNFQGQLQEIGKSIYDSVDSFALECEPHEGVVLIDSPSSSQTTVTVTGNQVRVSPAPDPGDTIQFHYFCIAK